jgi:hypothetical protein
MAKAVEIYRGIEIHESPLSLFEPMAAKAAPPLYTARVQEWLLIGGLGVLKEEIDRKLTGASAVGRTAP